MASVEGTSTLTPVVFFLIYELHPMDINNYAEWLHLKETWYIFSVALEHAEYVCKLTLKGKFKGNIEVEECLSV